MKKNCPYCNNITDPFEEMWINSPFLCKNHGDINVVFYKDNSRICMYNRILPSWYLYIIDNFMTLNKEQKTITILFDKNLTPENFEQKLKTYLTFQ